MEALALVVSDSPCHGAGSLHTLQCGTGVHPRAFPGTPDTSDPLN